MEEKGTQKKEEGMFDEHVIMCSKFIQIVHLPCIYTLCHVALQFR